MCGGAKYRHDGQTVTTYFPNPRVALPVILKSGGHELLPWGRRENQEGRLPPGGWARLDSVEGGKWKRYDPRPVRLAIEAFMEKDRAGRSRWYALAAGEFIQGLVASYDEVRRVYVVTVVPREPAQAAIHDRWPRLVRHSE